MNEKEKLASGKFVRCRCWNVIPIEAVHCPHCKTFNAATSSQHCPTCGQKILPKPQIQIKH